MMSLSARKKSFNSRSREGSDLSYPNMALVGIVSTRAPVKGATFRRRTSVRLVLLVSTRAPVKGATKLRAFLLIKKKGFNSRSREGSDADELNSLFTDIRVSTRAPVKGATSQAHNYSSCNGQFQLALP